MIKREFKIIGMDCAEETAILKRELGPLVGGDENLRFDLINGKLTVCFDDSVTRVEEIVPVVSRTGMKAVPWNEYIKKDSVSLPFLVRYGRNIMTLLSLICLGTGLWVHISRSGFSGAFMDSGVPGNGYPAGSIILYSCAMLFGAWFIFPKALFSARKLRPDMNLLMIIAVFGAVFIGEWFEGATVVVLFSISLLLESWSVSRARRAIGALMDLSPRKARYICPHDGNVEEKPVNEVPVGVTVLVKPGEKIPLDGILTKGSTTVDQAPITGESQPVFREPGDELFAGTINGDGSIAFRTTRQAEDTTLSRIIRMVSEAQSRRAKSEQWVETFARYYTPVMIVLALGIAVIPPLLFGGNWTGWIYEALVILVIACPCALVISTPVSIVAGLNAAARAGVLIKGGIYLEKPAHLKVIALDKTGTLTRGKPQVKSVISLNGYDEKKLLQLAAALESHSDHPLAGAVIRKAGEENIAIIPADNFEQIKGKGAEGSIDGCTFWIGSHRFLHEKAVESDEIHERLRHLENTGHSVIVIGTGKRVCGFITLADSLRPESREAVLQLKHAGIKKIVMLTGDNKGTAAAIAADIDIDAVRAELLPEDKVQAIESLVNEYRDVAMVGDGVNDAPAMAAAGLGIAMGAAGTDVAIETADIALMSDNLTKLPWLIRHAKRTLRIIKQNIFFALSLKVIFIILAVFGIATLWMAIAADTGASLLVIFNGLRLMRGTK